ncbi:MAG TPA: molybdopterin cofactor-binding domain-containing protein [Myxococcaceae bacterium]|jgi:carbon-monoxide dehydrogenase large subunit|nr:molybdopterin cofactor-binding domain-containing protein [Myxococcaceae bacterium]
MATQPATLERMIGKALKRREDPRFITGRGTYTDDVKLPGVTYAFFVRSPVAHARIRRVTTARAKAHPGVRAVFTGRDLADGGVNGIPTGWLLPNLKTTDRRAIAVDRVRYVGEAVAVVVADTPYAASDAAELVEVDYEQLPVVADATRALGKGAPQIHDNAPGNLCFHWEIGDRAKTEAALKGAARVVKVKLVNQRLIPTAIEPRASLASYSPATDELTLWLTSQNPHVHRLIMGAFVLGLPEQKFRVIAPDVGGGFGSKIPVYPEEVAVAWLAKKLGTPVKWTAERRESFLTDTHGRDHVSEVEMGFDTGGKVGGLRVKTVANLGAYLSLFAPAIPTYLYGTLLNGVYDIPAIFCEVDAAFTHTTPVDALRGAGRPEACYLIERTMDVAAHELKLDPAELRRRNLIGRDRFPFQTQVALVYDSGNYAPTLERALKMIGYEHFRSQQAEARKKGRCLGLGISSYIEACGIAPSQVVGSLGAQAGLYESATVRVHPTGKVTVLTGSHSHGQGHETTFSQIVADELGIPVDDVEIVHGDTGRIPFGMGTYGSRSGAVGGTAIHMSLEKLKDKGRRLAAHLLEAAPEDVEMKNGRFSIKGAPDRGKSFAEVSLAAYLAHSMPKDMEPGLEATSFFDPSNFTFPFGTHIAMVEVDPETGQTTLLRYVAVDDVGNVINPMIVDGQLHGGIAHGAAQALWEWASYDESGQLVTGSLMDYGVPRADQLPKYETERTVTPSPVNPLGVKGVGEAGTIASTAAVANAVLDALAPYGIVHVDIPLTPAKVWQAIQDAKTKGR